MALVEDFATYLADFGVAATLDGVAGLVIFDNPYRDAFDGMATRTPQAGLPTARTTGTTLTSTLVVGAQTFRVREIQPDGTGWTTLMLELQP